MTDAPEPDDQPTPPARPDYDDFRDENGVVQWAAFRAAVAAYDPGDEEAAPSGG
jgi:hypothetical protein